MAEQDLIYQPDYARIKRGIRKFHEVTDYPLQISLPGGRSMTFKDYGSFHFFVKQACLYHRDTGQKHPSTT